MHSHERPTDHQQRLDRALLSLDGLSIGDAFGQRFFMPEEYLRPKLLRRAFPDVPWFYTDDTVMGISVVDVLRDFGGIEQDALAAHFARRYITNPLRGYGGTAHGILRNIALGVPWKTAASDVFSGTGSMGNGAAMRVGPVGAYFADDLDAVIHHARRSAEVTHMHPEGQAGAIATAVAAYYACDPSKGAEGLLAFALDHTPDGETRAGIEQALRLPEGCSVTLAASALGSGEEVTAPDTVPFSLWCAARCLSDYQEALWTTVYGLGDRDTTCAIVGSIVALRVGREGIPADFLDAREPIDWQ